MPNNFVPYSNYWGVLVSCPSCQNKVQVSDVKKHMVINCGEGMTVPMSVDDILSWPLTTPPTTVKQHIASRRMMATGENSKRRETIQLPTAGQVRYQTNNDCFLVQNMYHMKLFYSSHLCSLMCRQHAYPLLKLVLRQFTDVVTIYRILEPVCPGYSFKRR